MKKLYIAWAVVVPLVGCTGMVGDDSAGFGGTDPAVGTGGSNGTSVQSAGSSGSGGASASAGSASSAGSGSGVNMDPGGVLAGGGAPAAGGSSGGACTADVLPATIQAMLSNRCATCHGPVPLPTLPSLVNYASLTGPSKSDPSKTYAVVSLARLQSATMPMPPAPGAPASAAEISALQDFIAQGYPKASCPSGGGGSGGMDASGGSGGGTVANDPLNAMPTCTSMSNWTGGNRGSASMNPGMACNACHKSGGEGPTFSIAGTVYPSGHEPDKCNSAVGNAGARVVIVGADGQTLTLTPNSAGNFSSRTAIKTPYKAKVTYQGRERLMITAQTSGDCNSCHTQKGSMLAPGRVTVP